MPGNLLIVSAPSGAGKTTLVRALLAQDPQVALSISYTTRAPRRGEIDGKDYHFIAIEQFQQMIERGEFLEFAQVHGNYYGTSQQWIDRETGQGRDILLEIDWQGAAQVRTRLRHAIGIFILPPSMAALESRLKGRAQDSPQAIEQRIAAAREEISHAAEFDYAIINDRFDDAARDLCCVVRAVRLKTALQLARFGDSIK